MYNYTNGLLPNDTYLVNNERLYYSTRSSLLNNKPKCRTKHFKKSILYIETDVSSNLPVGQKNMPTTVLLKVHV